MTQIAYQLSLATKAGGVGLWDYDVVNNILTWDEQMFTLYGITEESFSGAYEAWKTGLHPDDMDRGDKEFQMALSGEREYDAEFRVIWSDGTVHAIRALAIVQRDASGHPARMIGTNWDITKIKVAEGQFRAIQDELEQRVTDRTAELNQANRTLRLLNECDEALLRAKNEAELLDGICRIIAESGETKMTWIGFAEDDAEKTVRPVAQVGCDKEYLKQAWVTWADVPRGQGPAGVAIRTRKVDQCLDIPNNPCFAIWREAAMQRGYASMIAFPLLYEDQCLGALCIYSSRIEGFSNEEIHLFKQLAGNLAFGITTSRNRAERWRLQKELLRISEREKQLIAQDLHDGLCQNLAGTAMMSSLQHSQLAAKGLPDAKLAKEICDLLNATVNEARNLAHGLHPVGPKSEGLMNALAQLTSTVLNLFHINCTFVCPESVFLENETVSTHLFRITQEAINNARKHGQADCVIIGLHHTPEGLMLTIEDNGVGIPVKKPKKSGMGLDIMKHRASEIGATVSVRRAGKCGTVVTCTLPEG